MGSLLEPLAPRDEATILSTMIQVNSFKLEKTKIMCSTEKGSLCLIRTTAAQICLRVRALLSGSMFASQNLWIPQNTWHFEELGPVPSVVKNGCTYWTAFSPMFVSWRRAYTRVFSLACFIILVILAVNWTLFENLVFWHFENFVKTHYLRWYRGKYIYTELITHGPGIIWAKMRLRAYADSKGPDQTARTRSLIRAFAVR